MSGITNPAEAYFKDGLWTWDGSVWRKQPLLFGYTDNLLQRTTTSTLPAGAANVDLAAVPSSYVYVYTSLLFCYIGTPPTYAFVQIMRGGNPYELFSQLAPVSIQGYDREGWWVLKAADFVRLAIAGATLNDTAFIVGTGFALKINE